MRFRRHATTTHRKSAKGSPRQQPVLRVVKSEQAGTAKPSYYARGVAKTREAVQLAGSARMIAGLTLALLGIGLYMVSSASIVPSLQVSGSTLHFFESQAFFVLIGCLVALVISSIDYHRFLNSKIATGGLGLSIALLAYVIVNGVSIGGSTRWISVPGMLFQPSELAKFAVAIAISASLARLSEKRRDDAPKVIAVACIALPCALLVVIEPDFGTASIIVAIGLAGLYAVGVSGKTMLKAIGTLLAFASAYALVKPYAVARFTGLFSQGSDLLGKNYQLHQSKIAVASGGLSGKGFGGSTLKYGALPNPHTDFIFSILGEEFGLFGTVVVLALFGLFIWFGIRTAMRANDVAGTLVALTVTTWIGLQAFINIASVVGLFPVTGVPLPFISYGGTALVADLAAIGLLISVAKSEQPLRRAAPHAQKSKPRTEQRSVRSSRPSRQLVSSGAARPAQGPSRRSR